MLLNARQIFRADLDSKIILPAIEDITESKRVETEILKINDDLVQMKNEHMATLKLNIEHLEELNRVFVGRELKMIELKKQISALESKKA